MANTVMKIIPVILILLKDILMIMMSDRLLTGQCLPGLLDIPMDTIPSGL